MATSETGTGTSSGGEYQVFLSFRGPDTRRGFTDTLYNALVDAGIHVFIDNEELRPGERIGGNLLRAIDDSRLYIPIFSPNYASSPWCLRELAKMVENTFKSTGEGNKKVILPIFYNVKPDDVKLRTPLYSKMMEDQKEKFTSEDVDTWREALRRVGGTSGLDFENYKGDGHLSKTVVNEVVDRLKTRQRKVTEDLVGMEDRIAIINKLLGINSGGVRLIGICGMGGIGKTTLAKKIFNQLCPRFGKYCSFLDNVRETAKTKGLVKLQEQLLFDISNSGVARNIVNSDDGIKEIEGTICNKQVLIVLDDVDDGDQIRKLIGMNYLYPGSRILVTTRDNGVFNIREFKYGFEHYEPRGLSDEHALQLFSRHAFDDDSPPPDYDTLSKDMVYTAGGLPLALESIGASLYGVKNKKRWEERLEKLRKTPHMDVLGKLKISYDALEPDHQQIFLDVACFFIGENKTNPIYMWEDCGFGPEDAIEVLIDRCLIKVLDTNNFWMHDQFRDLGRAIAKEQCTRLWDRDDIICQLRSTEIKRSVQALCLQAKLGNPVTVTAKEIEQFPNLQFLWLTNVICQGDFTGCLSKLKWIYLSFQPSAVSTHDHPQFMTTNSHLENLAVSKGYRWTKDSFKSPFQIEEATKLKVLNLELCHWLDGTPTFSEFSVLEKLTILHCPLLAEIDCSIGKLSCLTELIVEYCGQLSKLPEQIGELKDLQHLSLKGCHNLCELPNSISKLESLTKLDVSYTSITSLPNSMDKLHSLSSLDLSRIRIVKLPGTMSKLSQLHTLDLSECHEIQELPELPISLTSLRLQSKSLQTIPDLSNLTNLVELFISNLPLYLSDDSDFSEVRSNLIQPFYFPWIGGLSKLRKMDLCLFNVHTTSTDWASLTLLEELTLEGLDLQMLQQLELDGLPQLEKLTIIRCLLTRLSITSSLRKLREATVDSCNELVEIQFLGVLISLEILDIRECGSLQRLVCVTEILDIRECGSLKRLVCVSEPTGCDEVARWLTDGLRRVSIVSGSLKMLHYLRLEKCPKLQEIQFGSMMESLENLFVNGCDSLRRLGGLSNLKNLKELLIQDADNLQIVQGIDELEHVDKLTIRCCKSVGRIIDIRTDPYGPDTYYATLMWERYRENILNELTQASAFDIETTFSDSKVETGHPLLEQQHDGDEDNENENDGTDDDGGSDDDEDNILLEEVLRSWGLHRFFSRGQ